MPSLNLRGVPTVTMQKLKSEAALAGRSLRDYCVAKLTGQMESSEQMESLPSEEPKTQTPSPSVKPDRLVGRTERGVTGRMIYDRQRHIP